MSDEWMKDRALLEEVLSNHTPYETPYLGTKMAIDIPEFLCSHCQSKWPCAIAIKAKRAVAESKNIPDLRETETF